MTSADQVPIGVEAAKSLLRTRLLDGEKIVSDYEEPLGCVGCWKGTRVRHVQLTTRRIIYREVHHRPCRKSPPLLRQILFKEMCEVGLDYSGHLGVHWLVHVFNFLVISGSFVTGVASLIYGTGFYKGYRITSSRNVYGYMARIWIIVGSIFMVIWFVLMVLFINRLCRKPVPEIVFGTRCPQLGTFAIRLPDKTQRIKLLEEVSALIYKS